MFSIRVLTNSTPTNTTKSIIASLRNDYYQCNLKRYSRAISLFSSTTRNDNNNNKTANKNKSNCNNFQVFETIESAKWDKPKVNVYYSSSYPSYKLKENVNSSDTKWIVKSSVVLQEENVDDIIKSKKLNNIVQNSLLKSFHHFLPANYPKSVEPNYIPFVTYQFISSVCGSATMVLSTQALLHAVGLSTGTALPISAALNWVMKDGIGQAGGILFASYVGHSKQFDFNPKKWRVVSSLVMDVATLLEMLCPFAPHYFLPIASVANILKNVGFLSASASRAALHQNIAIQGNLADVTAKAGSQSVAASLCGTTLAIAMSPFIGDHFSYLLYSFIVFSITNQACTYLSVKAVPLKHFNSHRLHLVLERYIQSIVAQEQLEIHNPNNNIDFHHPKTDQKHTVVLSPAQVAEKEKFLLPLIPKVFHNSNTFLDGSLWLHVGCPLTELCQNPKPFLQLQTIFCNENYILNIYDNTASTSSNVSGTSSSEKQLSQVIKISFLDDISGTDIVRAMLHAHIIHAYWNNNIRLPIPNNDSFDNQNENDKYMSIIRESHNIMKQYDASFIKDLQDSGWWLDTDHVCIESTDRRYRLKVQRD